MNYFDEVRTALQEAEEAKRAVRQYRNRMLSFIVGDLRGSDPHYLKKLKRELESFDARTGEWK